MIYVCAFEKSFSKISINQSICSNLFFSFCQISVPREELCFILIPERCVSSLQHYPQSAYHEVLWKRSETSKLLRMLNQLNTTAHAVPLVFTLNQRGAGADFEKLILWRTMQFQLLLSSGCVGDDHTLLWRTEHPLALRFPHHQDFLVLLKMYRSIWKMDCV